MTEAIVMDEALKSFLGFVKLEYGHEIAKECQDYIEQSLDADNIRPFDLLRMAKRKCKHQGEGLLLEHRPMHFCT